MILFKFVFKNFDKKLSYSLPDFWDGDQGLAIGPVQIYDIKKIIFDIKLFM